MPNAALILLLVGAAIASADGTRFVTLTAPLGITSKLVLTSEETVEFLTNADAMGALWLVKDGHQYLSTEARFAQGPCEVRLTGTYKERPGICTVMVHRSIQPPDKTVVIPPGQGAQITLQCSSNLVDWVTATNGIYTNVPSMKFFRIHSEKVP